MIKWGGYVPMKNTLHPYYALVQSNVFESTTAEENHA